MRLLLVAAALVTCILTTATLVKAGAIVTAPGGQSAFEGSSANFNLG